MQDEAPLSGIKVIDLTQARAGPSCVRILADMGASVVQVTRPTIGGLESGMPDFDYQNLHRNKRSVTIDLHTDDGHAVFLRLARDADVVVENFRPDVKRRLKIDYETLSAENPRLIYGSISGFGQDGPYSQRPGVDQIAQGLGGLMSITGQPGTGPWRVGIAVSDLCAGMFLAHGILAAIIERQRSGKGQYVHTSLLESMIAMLDFQATRWLIGKTIPPQAGNDHPTMFPMGVFKTQDGLINIAASGGRMWRDFLSVIGRPELDDDPRYKDAPSRASHREELRAACEEALQTQPSQHWIDALNAAGVPCGPILSVDQVFEDEQVRHLGMTRAVESERFGHLDLLRLPMRLSRTSPEVREAAPPPGRDTAAVLTEAGFSKTEVEDLVARGVIGA